MASSILELDLWSLIRQFFSLFVAATIGGVLIGGLAGATSAMEETTTLIINAPHAVVAAVATPEFASSVLEVPVGSPEIASYLANTSVFVVDDKVSSIILRRFGPQFAQEVVAELEIRVREGMIMLPEPLDQPSLELVPPTVLEKRALHPIGSAAAGGLIGFYVCSVLAALSVAAQRLRRGAALPG